MTAKRYSYTRDSEPHSADLRAERLLRLRPLFLVSAAIRGAVALLFVLGAVYVLRLLGTSDLVAWLVLGLTSAGLAVVMLDDTLDLEGKVAEQVAQAAVFDADAVGARAEAVRAYADNLLRLHGRIPHARTRIREPDTHRFFRVYFPARQTDCRRWSAVALLACVHSALRLIVVSLMVVVAVQLYFLST